MPITGQVIYVGKLRVAYQVLAIQRYPSPEAAELLEQAGKKPVIYYGIKLPDGKTVRTIYELTDGRFILKCT